LSRLQLALAALAGLMAVAAGAFGAHAAGDAQAKAWLQTGAHYQLTHALAVFACFVIWRAWAAPAAAVAGWLFLAGGLVFAGSLYLLALTGARGLGAVTPLGGVLLLAGWGTLAWAAFAGARSGG
jgi:uncharacterized membrane protein YgdD (TMEM256/DUF423 family)